MTIYTVPEAPRTGIRFLKDVLSDESREVYVFEQMYQRPYVWPGDNVRYLADTILGNHLENIEHGPKLNYAYTDIGSMDVSEVDAEYRKGEIRPELLRSVIDGRQRLTSCLFLRLAVKVVGDARCGVVEPILSGEFKTDEGIHKISEIGTGVSINKIYDYVYSTPAKEVYAAAMAKRRVAGDMQGEKEKDLFDVLYYCIQIIDEYVKTYKNLSLEDFDRTMLNNIYLKVDTVPIEEKFKRFIEKNTHGTGVSNDHICPLRIIHACPEIPDFISSEVDAAYRKFEAVVKQVESKKLLQLSRDTTTQVLFIMGEVLKLKLYTECGIDVFGIKYVSTHPEYGFDAVIKNKMYFRNQQECVDFFDVCTQYAKFVLNDSMARHAKFCDDWYMFKYGTKGMLYPPYFTMAFICMSYLDEERRSLVKDTVFRSYYIYDYAVRKTAMGLNDAQWLNSAIARINALILKYRTEDMSQFKYVLQDEVNKTVISKLDTEEIMSSLRSASYSNRSQRNNIPYIFIALEYSLIQKYGDILSHDGFAGFFTSVKKRGDQSPYDIDHIKPRATFGEEEISVRDQIGNLTLLEKNLNETKGADTDKGAELCNQSSLYSTCLLSGKYVGPFPAKELERLSGETVYGAFREKGLEDISTDQIIWRTKALSNFIIDFIKDPVRG